MKHSTTRTGSEGWREQQILDSQVETGGKRSANGKGGSRCECGRRPLVPAHAARARHGWIRRPHHDLCDRCWRSVRDAARSAAYRNTRLGVVIRNGSLTRNAGSPIRPIA